MKNKISDLRNHMFAALERLSSDDLSDDDLLKEIERAKAISEVGKVIVDSAKTEVMYYKMTCKKQESLTSGFIDDADAETFNEKTLVRPPANYDNKGHIQMLNKYATE